jgi:hypothetical protein
MLTSSRRNRMREPGLVRSRTNRPRAAPNQTKRRRAHPNQPRAFPKIRTNPRAGGIRTNPVCGSFPRTNPRGARPNELCLAGMWHGGGGADPVHGSARGAVSARTRLVAAFPERTRAVRVRTNPSVVKSRRFTPSFWSVVACCIGEVMR